MKRARVLVDDIDACASGGDLHHALRAGVMSKDDVHAGLAELAAGRKPGRTREDELVIFDSSGSGVQDVAAAWVACREARRTGIGGRFDLSGDQTYSPLPAGERQEGPALAATASPAS